MSATLLPTTLSGGYAHPGWYFQAQDAFAAGLFGPADLEEFCLDAVTVAVEDQKRAGLDVLCAGDVGRRDGPAGLFGRLAGLEPLPPNRRFGPGARDELRYQIVSEIACPAGLGLVDEFRYLRRIAGHEVKVGIPGPLTLAACIAPGGRYRTLLVLAEHLSLIVRQELIRLVEAGCRHVQVDEPALVAGAAAPADAVKLLNATVHGVEGAVLVNLGFSRAGGSTPAARRSYRHLFPAVLAIEASGLGLEFAGREMAEADLWLEYSPHQTLMAGVVDARNLYVETPDEIAARIRLLLRYVPEDKLTLAPDCGLAGLPRFAAFAKLANMVAAAVIVRGEIQAFNASRMEPAPGAASPMS